VLRNTLAGSKYVDSISRMSTVLALERVRGGHDHGYFDQLNISMSDNSKHKIS